MLLCILLHVVDHYKQFLNASRKVRLTMRQYIIVFLFLRLFKVHLREEEIFVKKNQRIEISVDCVHLVLFSVSPATCKALNFYVSS